MGVISKLRKNTFGLLILSTVIVLLTIFKLSDQPRVQLSVLTGLVLFYLIWGIFYHHIDKSLKTEIIIEYILTAALALSFIYGILL